MGANPRKEDQQNKKQNNDSPSTCFFSASRAWRPPSTICCRLTTVAPCSSRVRHWSSCEMLSVISSPSSLETSSYRSLRDARAPSSAARSCWSCSSASSRAKRSCSSVARASTRAAHSCWS
jgi:hypothetical protein